jgi:hypothetical protein
MSCSYWPRSPPLFPQDRQIHREEKENDVTNKEDFGNCNCISTLHFGSSGPR